MKLELIIHQVKALQKVNNKQKTYSQNLIIPSYSLILPELYCKIWSNCYPLAKHYTKDWKISLKDYYPYQRLKPYQAPILFELKGNNKMGNYHFEMGNYSNTSKLQI
jgi:hypothetical protein